jgi:Transglutaminase-like superfamily
LVSDARRVALAPIALTADGRVAWQMRAGRYVTLAGPEAELTLRVRAADGGLVNEICRTAEDDRAIHALEARGIVVIWDETAGLPVPPTVVLRAWMAHLAGRLLLATCGRWWLSNFVKLELKSSDARDERARWCGFEVEQLVAAMQSTTALPFVSSRCIEMTVGLWLMLRWRGRRPQLRLGAIPDPFHAHAWLELDGRRIETGALAFHGDVLARV